MPAMTMGELLRRIDVTSGCRVLPASGIPTVEEGHLMPADLVEFYARSGGAELFTTKPFSIDMSSPDQLVLANPVLVGERVPDDISDSWYIVGRAGAREFISVDLHPDRVGTCYDSFHEVHGVPGSCAVVALS